MKSKLLKCLSIGITAAMLAVSVIPLSAPSVLAAGEEDYYAYFTLPVKDTEDMKYSIYQIADATSYDPDSGFVTYTVDPLFTNDEHSRPLFKADAQGRIIYTTIEGTEVLFDVENFSEKNLEYSGQQYSRDLIDAAARVGDMVKANSPTAYENEVENSAGANLFTSKPMEKLENGLKVKLANGLYIMIGEGAKISSPNIIPVANYETAEPDASTESTQLYDKGADITVDKTITAVGTGTNEQNVADNADWGSKANNGNSAEVRVGSKVSFMIDSMTPSYDTSVKDAINDGTLTSLVADPLQPEDDAGIVNYVIYDDPSPSLTIDMDTVKVSVANEDNVGKLASDVAEDGWIEVIDDNAAQFNVGDATPATTAADIMTVETIATGSLSTNPFVQQAYNNHNDGAGFKVVFTDKFIVNQMDRAVKVEFDATVNDTLEDDQNLSGAVKGYEMPNTGLVQYDNMYTDGERDATVHAETVKLYRITIEIDKVDGTDTPMAGVTFTIYDSTGQTAVTNPQTTLSDGTITFDELPAGTYVLKETPKQGYQTAPDITFTITAATGNSGGYEGQYNLKVTNPVEGIGFVNGKLSLVPNALKIVNYKGQELPGTGGMGTVIFTVVGVGVIVLAGVLLVVYMRKRRVDED